MQVLLLTQARLGSTRLPRKVLLKVNEETMLDIHLNRINSSSMIDKVIVATTKEEGSEHICEIARRQGCDCFKGSTDNVLDRFYQAAKMYNPKWVVRLTSDCPLIDPELLESVIQSAIKSDFDYFSNILVEDFPDGQDIEVFKFSVLKEAWELSTHDYEKEHVTSFIIDNCDFNGGLKYSAGNFDSERKLGHLRMTLDEEVDYQVIKWLIEEIGTEASWTEYADLMLQHPDKLVNSHIARNEGFSKE